MDKIIGYTTGVFDLFHIGHLNLLKMAKSECDHLVVGVATDNLIESIKGKRPIIPLKERLLIVESIKYVDSVVPQKEINEINDWDLIKFNKIFKGDDWKGSERWNNLEIYFHPKGVKVVFFPYTQHTSSTFLRSILEFIAAEQGGNHAIPTRDGV